MIQYSLKDLDKIAGVTKRSNPAPALLVNPIEQHVGKPKRKKKMATKKGRRVAARARKAVGYTKMQKKYRTRLAKLRNKMLPYNPIFATYGGVPAYDYKARHKKKIAKVRSYQAPRGGKIKRISAHVRRVNPRRRSNPMNGSKALLRQAVVGGGAFIGAEALGALAEKIGIERGISFLAHPLAGAAAKGALMAIVAKKGGKLLKGNDKTSAVVGIGASAVTDVYEYFTKKPTTPAPVQPVNQALLIDEMGELVFDY